MGADLAHPVRIVVGSTRTRPGFPDDVFLQPGWTLTRHRNENDDGLVMIELGTDAAKLVSVLNYDGMPITADNIFRQIKGKLR